MIPDVRHDDCRGNPANRAVRELPQAVARIQAEGGTSDRMTRKRAEALLVRLRALPVAMLVADNRGRFVDVNAAAVFFTGYTRELLRRAVWDLTPAAGTGARAMESVPGTRADVRDIPAAEKERPCREGALFRRRQCLAGLHVSALAAVRLVRRFGHASVSDSGTARKRR
jgi:PAS domain S-box-containing protein